MGFLFAFKCQSVDLLPTPGLSVLLAWPQVHSVCASAHVLVMGCGVVVPVVRVVVVVVVLAVVVCFCFFAGRVLFPFFLRGEHAC